MSLQLQKISVPAEISFFRSINPFNFISSLTTTALKAIRNIGSLFSEETTFSQIQEEEIRRVNAALKPSSEEIELEQITKKNTQLNKNIAFEDKKERKSLSVFGLKTRNVSFYPIEIQWVFRKEQRLPANRCLALKEGEMPKPILKQHFCMCEVD